MLVLGGRDMAGVEKKDLPVDQPFKLLSDLKGLALAAILSSDRETTVFLRSVQNSKQLGDRSFSIRPLRERRNCMIVSSWR